MEFDTPRIMELLERMEQNYSLRPRHPEREGIYADYRARSERLRALMPDRKVYAYAVPARCAIDWFPASAAQAAPAEGVPLFVFIHGGFWRALDREIFSFMAEHYVKAGVAVAMIGYELAPAVRLGRIVEQVADAFVWLNRRAGELGFDPRRVSVSGHSAGGHLAAMISATPPTILEGHPLVATIPVSGLFSLAPLLLTSINHDVRMTPHEAMRLSPSEMQRFYTGEFIVAVGEAETEGFIGQSRDFAAAAKAAGSRATLEIVPRRTHFDVLEDLASPELALFQRVLGAVKGVPQLSDSHSI
ncbi:alpha/beta hydrolase [Variovorax sp. PBL-E5]|uniref:alpha/beta hydrolase n=1 Tax=Variovorax sp. PBL-E5 TaxID=434014 RepID=UPI00131851E1|nr:alpha/beta hydrolase [Variovorax sp. PBL-E5]VTU24123.1 Carboxylesterase NlhH [Variovorax sp. PBL-E5]